MSEEGVYLDDLSVGDTWTGGPIYMTEAGILAFANEFDPQPMHNDLEAAAHGRFGGIIASGWHVASLVMRDFVDAKFFGSTPLLGLSVDNLQWSRAVKPGDTLDIYREVVEINRSKSKPDRGTVRLKMIVNNQLGETVMSFSNLIQMPVRTQVGEQ